MMVTYAEFPLLACTAGYDYRVQRPAQTGYVEFSRTRKSNMLPNEPIGLPGFYEKQQNGSIMAFSFIDPQEKKGQENAHNRLKGKQN